MTLSKLLDYPHHIGYTIKLNDTIDTLPLLEKATVDFAVKLFKSMNNYTENLRVANL